MKIAVDKGQKAKKHDTKHEWLRNNGCELVETPLPIGDYILVDDAVQRVFDRRRDKLKKMDLLGVTRVSVDTKQNLGEVVNNVCGRTHDRFRDECILAQENGIRLIILVEHSRYIKSLGDVEKWKNPRQYVYEKEIRKAWGIPRGADFEQAVSELNRMGAGIKRRPTTGEELAKCMRTITERYGITWEFCDKKDTGKRIVELIGGGSSGAEKTA